jgi:hypothetical protein
MKVDLRDTIDQNEVFKVSGGATVVPIPTTIYLLGSGLVGMAAFRRKFKK